MHSPHGQSTSSTEKSWVEIQVQRGRLGAKHANIAQSGEDRRRADQGRDPWSWAEKGVLEGTRKNKHFPGERTPIFLPSHRHSNSESKTDFSNLF